MNWLQKRLNELNYTHHDLQKALEERGIKRVRATITGWANGKSVSLFNNPDHAKILAEVLDLTVLAMFYQAGYDVEIPEELIDFIQNYKNTTDKGRMMYRHHLEFATGYVPEIVDDNSEETETDDEGDDDASPPDTSS